MKHSIKTKIIFWIVLTIVFMGIFASALTFQNVKQTLLASKKENIGTTNAEKVKQLELILDNASLFIKMLATRTRVVEYLQNPTSARKKELQEIFDMYQKENSEYLSIYLMDTSGLTHISSDRSFIGVNYGFSPYFKDAMKGTPSVDIAYGKTTNRLGYYFSYPVEDVSGKVLGVTAVKLEPSSLFTGLVDEFKKNDITVMMTNLQGIILYSTERDRELKSLGTLSHTYQQELKKYNPFQGVTITHLWYEQVQRAIETYSTPTMMDMFDKVDNKNETLTINRVKNYPFYFITENELDVITNKIAEMSRLAGIGVFISALFCVCIASYAIGRLLTPMAKLKTYTQQLGKGDFSKGIILKTGDELEEFSTVLNQMQENIKEQYETLEMRVKERTAEADEALEEMERQKVELERGRSAVLNILEDERHLEEELKKEKEGVEKKVIERTLELANEKSRLTAAISSLPQAFLIVGTNNTIVTHNNRLEQILGESEGEWTLRKVNDRLSAKFDLEEHVQTAMKQKKAIQEREVLAGAKYTSVYIAPILSVKNTPTDEVIGAIITITDVTEARLIARSKDEFFSIASHELRTPLTAIRGNTAMILDYYAKELSNPQITGMVQDTHEASIRLIGIVNDFLDMSRLELGKMEYKTESVSLSRIAEKIVIELTASALKKETTILCNIQEEAIALGDPGKIEEILLNLVGNALKFTEKGNITITTRIEKEHIQVEVADTGKGISLLNQNLLFHKFQQAGSSLTTRDGAKGTGLGLYISRLMAEGMGGKLELIKSVENEGSVFCLTLPKYSKKT